MKNRSTFILPLLLLSCINSEGENFQYQEVPRNESIEEKNLPLKNDTLYFDLHKNSIKYIESQDMLLFTNSEGTYLIDTIWGLDFEEIVFEDRDLNGYEDVVYKGHENVEIEYLYCFDPEIKIFRKIEEHELHGFPMPLYEDSNIFYTFSPDGCSWKNWESRLYSIKDYRLLNIQSIYFDSCTEGAEEENGVSFNLYKWNGKKFILTICDSTELYNEASSWTNDSGIKEFWLEQNKGQKTKR